MGDMLEYFMIKIINDGMLLLCHFPTANNTLKQTGYSVYFKPIHITGCGFCKRIKPEYAQAATELKGQAVSIAFPTQAVV